MKKIDIFCIAFVYCLGMLVACQPSQHSLSQAKHPSWSYSATIYEMNIRQITNEGTFAAAENRLPDLRKNGIDILWIMPCQPIGKITRKGTLGSYYSIQNYKAINPEFGTMDDFKHFLQTAHKLGFKVILDWVANHTAPDHDWVKNEDWHVRDSLGNLVIQYDWTDIAKLNYANQDMRAEMKKTMCWWVDSIGIDGFRCDVAGEVPTDFWNDVMSDIRRAHPDLFTLAEDEAKADELTRTAFDMYYGWTLHHLMNKVAQGQASVADLWAYFNRTDTTIQPAAIRMNFTSNHDENSWNGTEFERLGPAADLFAVFTYLVPGMPLIYTGQLCGNHHRLAFFEKDVIDTDPNFDKSALYKTLNDFRKNNPALWSAEKGAKLVQIHCDNPSIFACTRVLEGKNRVIGIFNMSNHTTSVTLDMNGLEGEYTTLWGDKQMIATQETIELEPWKCLIISK